MPKKGREGTSRVCTSEEFEKRRNSISTLAMLGMPTGMRTAFESEWRHNFLLQDTILSGEPTLEDEITINGEKWEVWQGVFSGRGSFGADHCILIISRTPNSKEGWSLGAYKHYSWNTLGSRYLDWKWFLEEAKGDTVEAFFTRYINKEEHGGILSKRSKER